jgi:hypothetical protein
MLCASRQRSASWLLPAAVGIAIAIALNRGFAVRSRGRRGV